MLLGIPGDNTYSNYAEANRAFYRQTVVPLLARIASALGHWLGESFGGNLRLAPDLDEVPALSIEREALWKRVGEASFLTDDEKRAATGYAPLPASVAPAALAALLGKYDPNQPRVPAGNPDGGQWTSGGSGSGNDGRILSDANEDKPVLGAQYASDETQPPLRGLHPNSTYEIDQTAKSSLKYWRGQSTEKIVESLKPSENNKETLTAKPDGTITNGNTRLKVLTERGYNINSLPRMLHRPSGGGGMLRSLVPFL